MALDEDTANMLRDSVSRFAEAEGDLRLLREGRKTLPGYPQERWQAMTEAGWFTILVPEVHGGLDLGIEAAALVCRGLGRSLCADPFPAATLPLLALLRCCEGPQTDGLLAGIAEGTELPALAWQESPGGLDPSHILTRARREGTTFRLSGRKDFVIGAAGASRFLVTAREETGLCLFEVEPDAAGLSQRTLWRADGTPVATLCLDSVHARRLSAPGAAGAGMEEAVDEACLIACSESLGLMEALMEITLNHLRTREQFGRPIGAFQALQHRAADMFVHQQLAEASVASALRKVAAGVPAAERSAAVSRAKSRADTSTLLIAREAVQMHGAMGITDESDVGLYLKRALVISASFGTASQHRRRFTALAANEAPTADASIAGGPADEGKAFGNHRQTHASGGENANA